MLERRSQGGSLHDDRAAQARASGEQPLLPNEEPVRDQWWYDRSREILGPGYQRAGDYDKPYMPDAAFMVDSIAPSELTRPGRGGAPDLRYGDASFPNQPKYPISGTEARFRAEIEREKFGAPPLAREVDPRTYGRNSPTPLELAILAMNPGSQR